jgi:outer membrane protein assembly factor BamB
MVTSHKLLRIFVSHSHKDNDFGIRLIADLRAALGDDAAVWYDASGGLHGGEAWWRNIVAQISARSVFLVILSPDAMASPWVNDEIDLAWKQKNSPDGKIILPVLYRACQVREDLQTRQIVSFLPPKPYEMALGELFAALGLSVSAATTYKHPAQQTPPSAGEAQQPPESPAPRFPSPSSPTPAFPYLPAAARASSNPVEAVAQTSGRQTAASASPDGSPAPLPFPQLNPDGTPAPLPGIRLRAGSGRHRAQDSTATPSVPIEQQEQRRDAAAAPPSGPAGLAVRDGAPARLDRAPLGRRAFLRQGGIATGVGLAALAGAGLLAHATGFGQSSGRTGASGRQPTPSPTPVPIVSTPRWRFGLPNTTISGSPLLANGILYVGADSSDGTVYAIGDNGDHAQQVWTSRLGASVTTAPVIGAPGILCVTSNGRLFGLDTHTGHAVWQALYFDPLGAGLVDASPVVSSGALYLLQMFALLKYDAATGTRLRTDDMVYPSGTTWFPPTNPYLPAISGDYIYGITSFTPPMQVQQYRLTGGNPTWTYPIGANLTSPIADNGTVYVGASDGNVYALKPPATKALWIYAAAPVPGGLAPPIEHPPAVANGIVYATAGSTLHAIDATNGKAKWHMPIGVLAYTAPVVAGGVVYVGADKYVHAFDAASGKPLLRFDVGDTASLTPIISGKTLYTAASEGLVSAFAL